MRRWRWAGNGVGGVSRSFDELACVFCIGWSSHGVPAVATGVTRHARLQSAGRHARVPDMRERAGHYCSHRAVGRVPMETSHQHLPETGQQGMG